MKRFAGKTAIITGGASGIGFRTAELFAREGAAVVIADISCEAGRAAERRLAEQGGECRFVRADVSVEDEVMLLVRQAEEWKGTLDILVNNAAVFEELPLLETPTESWRRVFDVIVSGAYFCTKHVAAVMKRRKTGGVIVNVSSINGSRALAASSPYNAGKGALDQLTRCSALELAPYGIRVNAVAPGFVDTPMSVVGGVNELETEIFREYYVNMRKIPLARPARPEEVASVIAFLAGDESSYMQGAVVAVDGGLSITF